MKKTFKNLAVFAVATAMTASAFAGSISTEDAALDLQINVSASIEESYKVTVSNSEMSGAAQIGLLDLGKGGKLDALASFAAPQACKSKVGAAAAAEIVYASADVACTFVPGVTAGLSKMEFVSDYLVRIDLSGPGSIDLAVSLAGPGVGFDNYLSSEVKFGAAGTYAATAALTGLVDAAEHHLFHKAVVELNQGPEFEDTILIDVTKN